MGFLDPKPLSKAAADAAYAPVEGSSEYAPRALTPLFAGVGHSIAAEEASDWIINGYNFSRTNSSVTDVTWWTTDYDEALWFTQLEDARRLGANTVRFVGSYEAYAINPTQYKTRVNAVLTKAKSLGLQIIWCWLSGPWDALTPTKNTQYAAMVTDCIAGWIADPNIFAWEIGNEINVGGNADMLSVATTVANKCKELDPTTKVTGGGDRYTSDIAAYDPIVDFHDVHLWVTPSDKKMWITDPIDRARAATAKPIMIGEYGANPNPAGAGALVLGDDRQVAAYVAAMRRWVVAGDIMGGLMWSYQDASASKAFGVVDLNGNPRPVLAEQMLYPSRNMAAARDLVRYRSSPVVLDNFSRALSTTSVGQAPIGGTPEASGTSVWGISSTGAYLVTSDASAENCLVWDSRSADVEMDMEFAPGSYPNIGIILRYTDINNRIVCKYKDGGFVLQKWVNGVQSTIAGPLLVGTKYLGRIRVSLVGDEIVVYTFDRARYWTSGFTTPTATATKHGLYVRGGTDANKDVGSKAGRISIAVPGRTF